MKISKNLIASCGVTSALFIAASPVSANSFTEALTGGKAYGDLRLRFETVDQENALKDADALTLRTRVGYKTGEVAGFSAVVEFEDNRSVFGVDDFSVPPADFKKGEFSVIADPETTEVDQAVIKYKNSQFSASLGRQVLVLDNHRFVGHVGWRQDRQTFDGFGAALTPSEKLSVKYNYISKRNRIFAEAADIDSKDHLFNASYKASAGKITAYAYLLEVDNDTDNALDTYGVRFKGATKSGDTKILYTAEFASQESEAMGKEYDADYLLLEGGVVVNGITAKLGYESLGSDDGSFGFSTPLATLHKFNGWSDQFLGTPTAGLLDVYATVSTKIAGGKFVATYHDFSSDEDVSGTDDLGDEINLLYAKKFGKNYSAGIKYASYSAGDAVFKKVDTDKLWLWVGAKF